MNAHEGQAARRRFLKIAGTGAAVLLMGAGLSSKARADDLPPVTDADPTAKALGYVEDAGKTTDPKHKPGDACANCQFYGGDPTGRGPCQLFPGKSVNAKGWCVSHMPKK